MTGEAIPTWGELGMWWAAGLYIMAVVMLAGDGVPLRRAWGVVLRRVLAWAAAGALACLLPLGLVLRLDLGVPVRAIVALDRWGRAK